MKYKKGNNNPTLKINLTRVYQKQEEYNMFKRSTTADTSINSFHFSYQLKIFTFTFDTNS